MLARLASLRSKVSPCRVSPHPCAQRRRGMSGGLLGRSFSVTFRVEGAVAELSMVRTEPFLTPLRFVDSVGQRLLRMSICLFLLCFLQAGSRLAGEGE